MGPPSFMQLGDSRREMQCESQRDLRRLFLADGDQRALYEVRNDHKEAGLILADRHLRKGPPPWQPPRSLTQVVSTDVDVRRRPVALTSPMLYTVNRRRSGLFERVPSAYLWCHGE